MIATPEIDGVTFWGAGGMCPFQAEGTIDGHEFYFRYRGGRATFEADNRQVAELYGDDLKGFLDDPEFASLFTRLVAAWRGEPGPIVLDRPDITDSSAVTGPRFGEEAGESAENGWSVFATDHVLFGGTGHISPAEARRFAAALVATADALEAAQAQTGGAQ
ncbi:hypothetical protein [Nonomuraea rubra]|uniref:Uncharacterized protein n=1 Tax=Nonomuraea rubra TaxID=46180 RepID=A0A7X0U5P3_9ACTN|nr:hypothetical protein [Nonomuraea rubra]MBB6556232.1 hypothetical protein [Nonomuraea rubra]